jgi:uncharacterized protein
VTPRILADEMLGRLARYLRFVGCDVRYVQGVPDEELLRLARAEDRVIVTRDRQLSERAGRAVLLGSTDIAEQWRAVRRAFPDLAGEVRFERCTECNGVLETVPTPPPRTEAKGVPWDRVAAGLPLYRCSQCGHFYWEGTHTASIRRRLASWKEAPSA